jgi:dCMP deaminase
MVNQIEIDSAYMQMAKTWETLSKAKRKKVGALIVKDHQIISDGFNGTPTGFPNECEGEDGKTLPWVLHAESNAITKLAKGTQSSANATLYVTLSPCYQCSKLIIQAGIKRVVYTDDYSDQTGLELLSKSDIVVTKLSL